MSDDITDKRSPRSPALSLEEAIGIVRKAYQQMRTSSVNTDTAAKAMGYKTLNGASLGVLGSLTQYGLIDRTGGNVSISKLAMRILHPMGEADGANAIKEAAMAPRVFSDTLKGMQNCGEDLLTNHLVHADFGLERARKLAQIYAVNKTFAKLEQADFDRFNLVKKGESDIVPPFLPPPPPPVYIPPPPLPPPPFAPPQPPTVEKSAKHKVLANYKIPAGTGNLVELTFTGERLTLDDFDALADFVEFAKKRFERDERSAAMEAMHEEAEREREEREERRPPLVKVEDLV